MNKKKRICVELNWKEANLPMELPMENTPRSNGLLNVAPGRQMPMTGIGVSFLPVRVFTQQLFKKAKSKQSNPNWVEKHQLLSLAFTVLELVSGEAWAGGSLQIPEKFIAFLPCVNFLLHGTTVKFTLSYFFYYSGFTQRNTVLWSNSIILYAQKIPTRRPLSEKSPIQTSTHVYWSSVGLIGWVMGDKRHQTNVYLISDYGKLTLFSFVSNRDVGESLC